MATAVDRFIAPIFCACLVVQLAGSAWSQPAAPPPIPVATAPVESHAISKTSTFVGRVEAIGRVEIRARVKGFVDAVLFTEGMLVHEEDPLYRIEKGLFEADVQQAQGALDRSIATHQLAELQLDRAEELLSKKAGTAVDRDKARAEEQRAKATILSDQGNLQTAKINLGYTAITAPITGRIGRTSVTKGNVVGPDSGPLAIIVSQDPMYVTFPVSQREFLRRGDTAQKVDLKSIKVQIQFSDGSTYDQTGQIDFLDVSVDRTTDTVIARARMPNPAGNLTDGQLVRVLLESGTPDNKLVVRQSALIADQGGTYVFVVQDGKAVVKRVKLGAEAGSDIVVEDGLAAGDQVIVEGLQTVRAGSPVRARPAPKELGGA
ncbi:MAG: efflux transporter, family, subunit [Hyphomicrobiales bacterium]|nr:efflux transporter, family, subunit [Hyphomicrobiales bacterium]